VRGLIIGAAAVLAVSTLVGIGILTGRSGGRTPERIQASFFDRCFDGRLTADDEGNDCDDTVDHKGRFGSDGGLTGV
jgi:hypothetical protein